MANRPTAPARSYDFSDFQTANPTSPLPGQNVDQELDAIYAAIAAIISWANSAISDTGTIGSGSVGLGSIDPTALATITGSSNAAAAAASAANAATYATSAAGSASSASGSATTATQKAADAAYYASIAQSIAVGGGVPASAVTFTPTGTIAATNVQTAIAEVAAEAAPLVHTHTIANTTGLQTALDNKLDDSQASSIGLSVLGAADAAAIRTLLGLEPAGMVQAFARTTAPSNWLACNGAAVSRTTYAALFAAIGTTFGAGDGSTTFTLPNLQDDFIRGASGTRPVGNRETADIQSHGHGATSSSSGTVTVDAGGAHTHGFTDNTAAPTLTVGAQQNSSSPPSQTNNVAPPSSFTNPGDGSITYSWKTLTFAQGATSAADTTASGGSHGHTGSISVSTTTTITATGGTETRPRNVALLYCIRI